MSRRRNEEGIKRVNVVMEDDYVRQWDHLRRRWTIEADVDTPISREVFLAEVMEFMLPFLEKFSAIADAHSLREALRTLDEEGLFGQPSADIIDDAHVQDVDGEVRQSIHVKVRREDILRAELVLLSWRHDHIDRDMLLRSLVCVGLPQVQSLKEIPSDEQSLRTALARSLG